MCWRSSPRPRVRSSHDARYKRAPEATPPRFGSQRMRPRRPRLGDRGHRQLRGRSRPFPRWPWRDGARDQPHAKGGAAPARQRRLPRRHSDGTGSAGERDTRASAQRGTARSTAAAAGRASQRRRRAPRSTRATTWRDRHGARTSCAGFRSEGCSNAVATCVARVRRRSRAARLGSAFGESQPVVRPASSGLLVDQPLAQQQLREPVASPLRRSITPAATVRACTSSPTQLPSFITGASRNCGSTAGPIPTATRANLRARRRALHTVRPGRPSATSAGPCRTTVPFHSRAPRGRAADSRALLLPIARLGLRAVRRRSEG
jgi:hypothetical protein